MNVTGPRAYFLGLQSRIVDALEAIDGQPFRRDEWARPEGGGGISRLIEEGSVFERGGVNFSHVHGDRLPPSATASRPDIADRAWEAMGVSLVPHPRNPYAPTVHMNADVHARDEARNRRTPAGRLVVRRRDGPHALLRFR
jgi:coproporphyrinogen III oxidase